MTCWMIYEASAWNEEFRETLVPDYFFIWGRDNAVSFKSNGPELKVLRKSSILRLDED